MRFLFLILVISFGISMGLKAQTVIVNGVVIDSVSSKPLAFVNILSVGNVGAVTDIDGRFSIKVNQNDCCLKLTYVGYKTAVYHINFDEEYQNIKLSRNVINLDEVVVFSQENPAHRIINKVIDNRNVNNPKKIPQFKYTSYDKMIFTVNVDSIIQNSKPVKKNNTNDIADFVKDKDLFIMETVTEHSYLSPGLNQENIVATKVSGLNDPVMAFIISQLQSTSFYDELIQIAGIDYVNPISKGSTKKYFFLIEDTLISQTDDTVFIISFRPRKGTNFTGLKGFLHINTNRWAVQYVKAEPNKEQNGISVKIQQGYKFVQGHWFPNQLNTDIIFKTATADKDGGSYPIVAVGRSYIKDINLNPNLSRKDFSYHEVEIDKNATKRNVDYWNKHRVNSLTNREIETYRIIDSIGKAQNFDKMIATFQSLITGKIPLGFVNIDFGKIFHYNNFEGLYLGMGLHTNDFVSDKFTVGGFWGYGTRDKSAKYGADLTININKHSESSIRVDAYNKVVPSGGVEFFDDRLQAWRPEYFYEFFYTRMNKIIGGELAYSFRIRAIRDFSWNTGLKIQEKYPIDNYYFTSTSLPFDTVTNFHTTKFTIGFKYAFRNKVLQTTRGNISLGSKYPTIWLAYTRGSEILSGQMRFNRIDFKLNYTHEFKYIGESNIIVKAGIIDGEVPISDLFNGLGTYDAFTIYAPGSFGTMRSNEFYSDKYISLFLTHNFKNLFFNFGNYKPEFVVVTNIAFGDMNNVENHHNITFNTLSNGYFESGIIIRKLLNLQLYDIGAGVLYRYGAYGFDTPSKNLAYKISLYYAF